MTTESSGSAVLGPAAGKNVVVFDLDGVIVNSLAVMREAFTVAYAEIVGDGPAPFEEYERHQGRYFPDIMRIMGLPLELEEPFVRESYRLSPTVPVFDGIAELLATLRARGFQFAVATGKSGIRARALLRELRLLELFDYVLGSDEVDRPKPAPDIVLRALSLLGARPEDAVMVGDAAADIISARAAAVTPVGALWGPSASETELRTAGAEFLVRTPAELANLVSPPVAVRSGGLRPVVSDQ
jgi:AHBA synthesis associated protein